MFTFEYHVNKIKFRLLLIGNKERFTVYFLRKLFLPQDFHYLQTHILQRHTPKPRITGCSPYKYVFRTGIEFVTRSVESESLSHCATVLSIKLQLSKREIKLLLYLVL